jgi:hypothetical protein
MSLNNNAVLYIHFCNFSNHQEKFVLFINIFFWSQVSPMQTKNTFKHPPYIFYQISALQFTTKCRILFIIIKSMVNT